MSQIATSCLSSGGRAFNAASLKRFTLARYFLESPIENIVALGSSKNTILNTTNCKTRLMSAPLQDVPEGVHEKTQGTVPNSVPEVEVVIIYISNAAATF